MLRRNILLAALTRYATNQTIVGAETLVSIYGLDYETAEEIITVFDEHGALMIAALIMNDPLYLDKTLLTPAINRYIHDTKVKHNCVTRIMLCPSEDIALVLEFTKGVRRIIEPFVCDGMLVTDVSDAGKIVIVQMLSNQGVELNRVIIGNSNDDRVYHELISTHAVCFLRIWKIYKNYHITADHISFYSTLHRVSQNHVSKRLVPDHKIKLPLCHLTHNTLIGRIIVHSVPA